MPVTLWEALREGPDDYLYIDTLERTIAAARESGNAEAAAADEAQRELDYIRENINVLPRYQCDGLWPAGDFDSYRWLVAEQIIS